MAKSRTLTTDPTQAASGLANELLVWASETTEYGSDAVSFRVAHIVQAVNLVGTEPCSHVSIKRGKETLTVKFNEGDEDTYDVTLSLDYPDCV